MFSETEEERWLGMDKTNVTYLAGTLVTELAAHCPSLRSLTIHAGRLHNLGHYCECEQIKPALLGGGDDADARWLLPRRQELRHPAASIWCLVLQLTTTCACKRR